jgi:hypothetical protein
MLTDKSCGQCNDILIDFEKLFSKIETEFEKCLRICIAISSKRESSHLTYASFLKAQNLEFYLQNDQVLSFYKNLFFVKKIQTIHLCLNSCYQFNQYFFGKNFNS